MTPESSIGDSAYHLPAPTVVFRRRRPAVDLPIPYALTPLAKQAPPAPEALPRVDAQVEPPRAPPRRIVRLPAAPSPPAPPPADPPAPQPAARSLDPARPPVAIAELQHPSDRFRCSRLGAAVIPASTCVRRQLAAGNRPDIRGAGRTGKNIEAHMRACRFAICTNCAEGDAVADRLLEIAGEGR